MTKILVVEDSIDVLELIIFFLEKNNYVVETASSRTELISKMTSFDPDLFLLDVMLGQDDGRQICLEVKAEFPNIPVILLSANQKLLENYEHYKADAAIEKPFNISTVINKINQLID